MVPCPSQPWIAAAVERSPQAVVDDAAEVPEDPAGVEAEVIRRGGAVVDAAVGDVHREPGGGELGLREAPRERNDRVARTGEAPPDERPGQDLSLLLVAHPGDDVGLDRHDVRPLGEGG